MEKWHLFWDFLHWELSDSTYLLSTEKKFSHQRRIGIERQREKKCASNERISKAHARIIRLSRSGVAKVSFAFFPIHWQLFFCFAHIFFLSLCVSRFEWFWVMFLHHNCLWLPDFWLKFDSNLYGNLIALRILKHLSGGLHGKINKFWDNRTYFIRWRNQQQLTQFTVLMMKWNW